MYVMAFIVGQGCRNYVGVSDMFRGKMIKMMI